MGTTWSLRFFADPGFPEARLKRALEARFADVISIFSTWDDGSFISQLNRLSDTDTLTPPQSFLVVWRFAVEIAEASSGAFCPFSVGSWRDASSVLDGKTTISRPQGVVFDLSAIAKGYAVDMMSAEVSQFGIESSLCEIGGEFVGRGLKSDGQPWWIDLETPTRSQQKIRVALVNSALATSGHRYNSSFTPSGFASHVRGKSDDMDASVSVIAENCMLADAWATALLAAGETGVELAESSGLAAIFQSASHDVVYSSVAKRLLEN